MIIGYARVSTEEQNLALQITALKQAGCRRVFQDKASGTTTFRPGLEKALASLKRGDTLVVWRLDRLGRSLKHLVDTIHDFDKKGVHFRSLNESIDTSNSGGRLVFHIMAAMAEFERALISERTRAGMKIAQQSGQRIGRPPALSAEEQIEVLRALGDGISKTTLARKFGVSVKTILRYEEDRSPEGADSMGIRTS